MKAIIIAQLCLSLVITLAAVHSHANTKSDELRQANQQVLQSMPPAQVAKLDAALAEALAAYYSSDYRSALRQFLEIANQVETLDLMFWTGTSAAKLRDYNLAKKKFEQMLSIDPNLYRVRLEYADVLYKTGGLSNAREELELVRTFSPPPAVMSNINRRLATINSTYKTTRWSFDFSTGYQYDDNVSSGPDADIIDIATGTLTLIPSQQDVGGDNWLARARASVLHDIGEPGSVIWASKLDFYSSVTSDNSQYNFMSTDIATGPVWATGKYLFRLPVGYQDIRYGKEGLYANIYIKPTVSYTVNDTWSIRAAYELSDETYDDRRFSGNDNTFQRFAFGPNIYFNSRKHTLSMYAAVEVRDADTKVFSYDSIGLEATWFTRINASMDLQLRYRYQERDYDAPAPLFTGDREDERNTFTAEMNYRFLQSYYVSFAYMFMDNGSNADLYEFDKNTLSVNFGMNL